MINDTKKGFFFITFFLFFLPTVLQLVVPKPPTEIRPAPERGRENSSEPKPGHCAWLHCHSEKDKTRRGKTDDDFALNQPRWRSVAQKSQQRRRATFCLGPNRSTCATRNFTTMSCCSTAAWSSPTSTTTTTTGGPTATSTPAASATSSPTPCSRWTCAPRSSRCPSVKDHPETPASKLGPGETPQRGLSRAEGQRVASHSSDSKTARSQMGCSCNLPALLRRGVIPACTRLSLSLLLRPELPRRTTEWSCQSSLRPER